MGRWVTGPQRAALTALKVLDLAAVVVCFAATSVTVARHGMSVEEFLAMRVRISNVLLLGALLLVWHVIFVAFGVYRSKRLTSRWREIAGLVEAAAVGSAGIYLIAVSSRIAMVQGPFLPVFFVMTSITLALSRVLMRALLGAVRRRGRDLRHILVVGTNRRALAFAMNLQGRPELGCRLVGFVDSCPWDAEEFARCGQPLVGDIDALPELLRREVVDEVVVCLPVKSFYDQGSRIVRQCHALGIRVTLPSPLFDVESARVITHVDEDDPSVTLATRAIEGAPAAVKRVFDVVVSAVLLVLLAPLLVTVAALVKWTSPGPVLFSGERVGLNRRRFRMLKFRTMVAGAERMQAQLEHLNEASGAVFKIRNDPRLTPIGALLRSSSIDELPQLVNVLRGELSLVGPRPLPVRDYERFASDVHRRRFSVRPGITCLWQIGGRSDVSFDRWMELDLEYIDTWSLWLDLKILVKTVPAVLRGTGAA
jgi:exopolysaccharide biosynthesis polyprenyl glycosylphosphotransferase